jgi:O-methyltransferase involved in polyketide biosynthesis
VGRFSWNLEVDLPASQEWKRERLEAAKVRVPGNLAFAPIDFETTSLREGLAARDFDFHAQRVFSQLE